MNLSAIIQQKIHSEGPLSFRDFMQLALYHPEHGYYTAGNNKIGSRGDYYTSPGLTPAFGAMIGRQIEEMWTYLGKGPFMLVEIGAGSGQLCYDILEYLRDNNPPLYQQISYAIVEKRPALQSYGQALFPKKITLYETFSELPAINGCVLSNELIDNFPVHRVVMKEQLMEIFVGEQNGRFVELRQPAGEELKMYLTELGIQLPRGFCTEIGLDTVKWLKAVAEKLEKGYVLTIDYGGTSAELYRENRSAGTLVCYHRHRVSEDPYVDIGEQDITAHVNFSALSHWGNRYGLETCGLTTQSDFLLALGWKDYLGQRNVSEQDLAQAARDQSRLEHTLLLEMGHQFRVLLQRKGNVSSKLMGLKKG